MTGRTVTHLITVVVAGLLLLPPGQTGHPAQQPLGQTSRAGLVVGVALLPLLLTVVLPLPLVLPGVLLSWAWVTLRRVGTLRTLGRI